MGDEAPRGPTLVHRAVARFARARPDAVAAWLGDERLTYADLDRRSDRLAALLRARGVGPEVHVAVALGPSFSLLVALIAIFKAGGVYMPLDPGHPAALRERMLDDAAPAVLLIDVRTPSDVRGRGRCLAVDDVSDPVEARAEVAPSLADDLDCAATLFYTSGTTGEPKGVTGTHRNLAHHLDRARERYRFDADDVFSAVARTTFSISLFELLSPLACGGSVRLLSRDQVLSPDRLACILDEVTVVHAGPSLLASLFRHLAREQPLRTFPRVRHASTGGDLAPAGTLEEMTRRFENAEVFVIYGCTELSCMATTVEIAAG